MAEPPPTSQTPIFNLQAYSPAEIKEAVEKVGVKKANLPFLTSFMLAVVAGGGIGFGAVYYTIVASDPTFSFATVRVVGGLVFSLGLALVLVGESDHPDFHALADRLSESLPRSTRETIPGAGHLPSLEQPVAFDEGRLVAVDQDVVDGRILEQGLQRPQAGHLVEDFRDELVELLGVERQPLDDDILRDELLDMRPHLVFGQLFQRREIDLLDQPAVQPYFGIEQPVTE